MSFQWPLALVGLVVVPVLVAVYIRRERRRADFAARFTTPALLPNLVAAAPKWRRHLPLAVLLLALTAMVVGVARPHATLTVKREDATVILVIDTSLSMGAQDVKPSRLDAALIVDSSEPIFVERSIVATDEASSSIGVVVG